MLISQVENHGLEQKVIRETTYNTDVLARFVNVDEPKLLDEPITTLLRMLKE